MDEACYQGFLLKLFLQHMVDFTLQIPMEMGFQIILTMMMMVTVSLTTKRVSTLRTLQSLVVDEMRFFYSKEQTNK